MFDGTNQKPDPNEKTKSSHTSKAASTSHFHFQDIAFFKTTCFVPDEKTHTISSYLHLKNALLIGNFCENLIIKETTLISINAFRLG